MIYETETDYPMRIEYSINDDGPDIEKIQVKFYEYWLDVPDEYFKESEKNFQAEIAAELHEQEYNSGFC